MSTTTTADLLTRLMADMDRSIPTDVLPPVAESKHVAKCIGTTEAALAQERYLHKGIPYTKIGRRVRYLRSDVLAYLAANRIAGAA